MEAAPQKKSKKEIVSAKHLATADGWQLSELEYGLILSYNAFNRWMVRCASAAGSRDLGPLEILVLHHINHRDREKKLSDICFILNIEDTHVVNYALKKLVSAGLVKGLKRGKEKIYCATSKGVAFCEEYKNIRQECLIETFKVMQYNIDDASSIATFLRMMSGIYDQAARAASSF